MYFHIVGGTGSYTTSTTNMYKTSRTDVVPVGAVTDASGHAIEFDHLDQFAFQHVPFSNGAIVADGHDNIFVFWVDADAPQLVAAVAGHHGSRRKVSVDVAAVDGRDFKQFAAFVGHQYGVPVVAQAHAADDRGIRREGVHVEIAHQIQVGGGPHAHFAIVPARDQTVRARVHDVDGAC